MSELVFFRRGKEVLRVGLERERLVIGSGEDSDIALPDPHLSPRHVSLLHDGSRCLLEDLSGQGVPVAGKPMTYGELSDGVDLMLGQWRALFRQRGPADTSSPTRDGPHTHSVLRVGETELSFEVPPQPSQEHAFHGIIGTAPAVRELVRIIRRMPTMPDVPTLLLGESGTGKELVARAIHENSARAHKAFIPVNCAAIPAAQLERELFGHEKGAFTGATARRQGAFEAAHGGTLFLDEVSELPLELQARLLRAVERGEVGALQSLRVDVRVVAGTSRNLSAEVRAGRFRTDLYSRLYVVPLMVPSLRSRREDIRLLAEHFLRAHAPREQAVRFTPAALTKLQRYSWPGNMRELRNVVCRALLERKGPEINSAGLSFKPRDHRAREDVGMAEAPLELPEGVTLEQMMERVERQLIESTLLHCNGNRAAAARRLGLARSALFKRLKAWGLSAEKET